MLLLCCSTEVALTARLQKEINRKEKGKEERRGVKKYRRRNLPCEAKQTGRKFPDRSIELADFLGWKYG